jgi:predicted HTH domain antitoxin
VISLVWRQFAPHNERDTNRRLKHRRAAMPLTISDETLQKAGMSADEARVEIACRLFDAGKLELWPAAQLAQMSRSEFEGELLERKIPIYRPTLEDIKGELEAFEQLRK